MHRYIRRVIRAFWQPLPERIAQARYFDAGDQFGDLLWESLPRAEDATDRAHILGCLEELSTEMADANAIYDNDRADDDGFTPEEWERSSAALYSMVASAERVTNPVVDHIRITNYDASALLKVTPEAESILERFSAATSVAEKAALIMELYHSVVHTVGGQAAEGLAALSAAYFMAAGYDQVEARNAMSQL